MIIIIIIAYLKEFDDQQMTAKGKAVLWRHGSVHKLSITQPCRLSCVESVFIYLLLTDGVLPSEL